MPQIEEFYEQRAGGTTGVVWRARDDLGREVAVKFFNHPIATIRDAVVRQAHALAQIDHPNVVRIITVEDLVRPGSPDGSTEPALIMEFVEGQKFSDWLTKSGITKAEARNVIDGMLAGLAAFHTQGLSHGDLHGGNIHVFEGQARLIDPLAHDPIVALTSQSFRDGQRRDIFSVKPLVIQALVAADANSQELGEFGVTHTGELTISLLREHVRLCLSSSSLTARSTSAGPPMRSFYDMCREAQRANDPVRWQELRKSAVRSLDPQLQQWRNNHPYIPGQPELYVPLLSDALNTVGDFLSLILSASEFGTEPYANDVRLAKRLLSSTDVATSQTDGIASFLFYCAHHFAGASAIASGHAQLAAGMATINILDAYGNAPLWKKYHLTGWPELLNNNAPEAFSFLDKCFALVPVLRQVFDSSRSFRVALTAYNFLLCCVQFVNQPVDKLSTAASGQTTYESSIYPSFLWYSRADLEAFWDLLFEDQPGREAILAAGLLSESDFEKYWPTLVRTSLQSAGERAWRVSHSEFFNRPPRKFIPMVRLP